MPRTPAPEAASVTPLRRPLGVVVVDALPVVRGRARAARSTSSRTSRSWRPRTTRGGAPGARADPSQPRGELVGLGLDGDLDAGWLIRTVRERFPSHAVLALGANADAAAYQRALFVGADGYVDKSVAPDGSSTRSGGPSRGEMVLEGPETGDLGDIAVALDRRRDIDTILTSRELQVLTVAAEGLTAKQIADRLGVRERTVTTHLGRIYGKLGVGSRLAAIRTAARSGLVGVGARRVACSALRARAPPRRRPRTTTSHPGVASSAAPDPDRRPRRSAPRPPSGRSDLVESRPANRQQLAVVVPDIGGERARSGRRRRRARRELANSSHEPHGWWAITRVPGGSAATAPVTPGGAASRKSGRPRHHGQREDDATRRR